MFQAALQESQEEPDVVCMLAQVLWAKGGQQEKDAARSQLLDCISNNEGHVQAVSLLAVIGLVDGDTDIIEAVEDDLKALLTKNSTSASDKMRVGKVLTAVLLHRRGSTDSEVLPSIGDATSNIMLSPAQVQGWMELSQATPNDYAAEMAQKNALRQMPPGGTLAAEDVAEVYANKSGRENILQAKMLAPWTIEGGATFADSL
jgi:superkiller protein 3